MHRYELTDTRPDHKSATCFVFKAIDRHDIDSRGNPRPVAIKLMRFEAQFRREIDARSQNFDEHFVMPILRTHHPQGAQIAFDSNEVVTKERAESLWCCVMPLADRNLFVAIKQERFAGVDLDQVRVQFTLNC